MQLHFKEYGDADKGRAIILLHGLFGSADNWYHVAQQLAPDFHVFAVDQRNHGQSPHAAEMDYPLMAADLDEFMTAHGLATACILGHSMGGKTAMQFALQYPERVEKLIVADMAPRAYEPSHDEIFDALLELDLSKYQARQEIEEALAPKIPNLILRRFLLKNLGRDESGRFTWKINLEGIWKNYPRLGDELSAVAPFTKPTLFISGGRSDYVRPGDENLIHQLFPSARIEVIAAASHWIHADQPVEFLRLVFDFLN
jgi:esterase